MAVNGHNYHTQDNLMARRPSDHWCYRSDHRWMESTEGLDVCHHFLVGLLGHSHTIGRHAKVSAMSECIPVTFRSSIILDQQTRIALTPINPGCSHILGWRSHLGR